MDALIKTNFKFEEQKDLYIGKVRDVYNIDNNFLVMIVSDRISAFDVVLPNGKTLAEFLYSHDSEIQGKELSLKQFLSSIFLKLSNQDVDIEIIKEKIKCNSIENCFGIISLHKISVPFINKDIKGM